MRRLQRPVLLRPVQIINGGASSVIEIEDNGEDVTAISHTGFVRYCSAYKRTDVL